MFHISVSCDDMKELGLATARADASYHQEADSIVRAASTAVHCLEPTASFAYMSIIKCRCTHSHSAQSCRLHACACIVRRCGLYCRVYIRYILQYAVYTSLPPRCGTVPVLTRRESAANTDQVRYADLP